MDCISNPFLMGSMPEQGKFSRKLAAHQEQEVLQTYTLTQSIPVLRGIRLAARFLVSTLHLNNCVTTQEEVLTLDGNVMLQIYLI